LRILLVSHPPLAAELGASQVALNLARALRGRGHDAVAWSPEPLPEPVRRFRRWRDQARAIEEHAAREGPWDLIDAPAISITPRLARLGRVIARSVQPELPYFADDLRAQARRLAPRLPAIALHHLLAGRAVVEGWNRAALILCQGSLEREWMLRRFPRLEPRLRQYVVAPSAEEQAAFAAVRAGRESAPAGADAGRATDPAGGGEDRGTAPASRGAGRATGPAGKGEDRSTPPAGAGAGRRFLWIGRWAAHKGIRTLVRFLRERALASPADRFTLAGCGEAARRDIPPALLAAGRVLLVPSFTRVELPGLLAAHDAGLFTSVVEGWGLCLNEMLEAGLTVYATRAGGVPDLAPFWGPRLQPFPPPLGEPERVRVNPDVDGYLGRFSWPAIARAYEAALAAEPDAGDASPGDARAGSGRAAPTPATEH
jgi:glycosyltransferase involved in cell wall biosynthesis